MNRLWNLQSVTCTELRNNSRKLCEKTRQSNRPFSPPLEFFHVTKIIRNCIFGTMAAVWALLKLYPLMLGLGNLRQEWTRKNMKADMSCILITDETKATLDGIESWESVWVYLRDGSHQLLRCQQLSGAVRFLGWYLWKRIVGKIRAI